MHSDCTFNIDVNVCRPMCTQPAIVVMQLF